ncbi:TolC family outer membrane protein [Shewanella algae]|uniref:TolC family outer membrane protein n=1 Tax=Shewanella algae TaxID=38313 RepID=UPI001AAD14C3|nr:TolC family outer membrane protein [Shewanella algae]MBO2629050.1 TolC family outer membrane protein [Shewanella algae]QTE93297.1 TolC family outer membrane protein [Shewanella algae]
MNLNRKITKLALVIGLQTQALPSYAQSLEEAVSHTLATHPEIRSAYNEFMSRHELTNAARGEYMPSLDLQAGVGYEDYNNKLGTQGEFDPRNVKISIRQLLWDGSATYNDIQRNKSETEAQRFQLLSDAQDIALKATENYLNVLRAQEVLALSEANNRVHEKMYTDIRKRSDSGFGSTADLAQIEGRLARSQTNLLAAQSNLDDKITEFVRNVGAYPQDLVRPEVDINYLPQTREDALKLAKENNPVVYVASNDIDAAHSQYEQEKGNFLPTFAIEGSKEWGDELNGSRGDTDEFKAMLTMRYNLFNGGTDAAKSRRAAYQINKSKDIRDKAYRMLDESTLLAWSAMELANKQTQFLQQHVDASARTVIAYEKQFRIGKRTLLDLLNTENELFESRKAYINARYDGIFARYRLLNATGTLLTEMRVDVPESWLKSVKE